MEMAKTPQEKFCKIEIECMEKSGVKKCSKTSKGDCNNFDLKNIEEHPTTSY